MSSDEAGLGFMDLTGVRDEAVFYLPELRLPAVLRLLRLVDVVWR